MNQSQSDIKCYVSMKLSRGYEELRSQSDENYQSSREDLNERGMIGSGLDNKLLCDKQTELYKNILKLTIKTYKDAWSRFGIAPTDEDQRLLIDKIKEDLNLNSFLASIHQVHWMDDRMKEAVTQRLKNELTLQADGIERDVFIAVADARNLIINKRKTIPEIEGRKKESKNFFKRLACNQYFEGIIITVIGGIVLYYLLPDRKQNVENASGSKPVVTITDGKEERPIPKPALQDRELTRRTPRELLSFYSPDRTQLEASRLMQPHIGQWIEISEKVVEVGHGAPDGDQMAVILKDGNDQIDCRFKREWKDKLDRLTKGEPIKILGKISTIQNGSQLYLEECEIR